MRFKFGMPLGLLAVAGLTVFVQFGLATSADARRVAVRGVRHVHVHHHRHHAARRVARGVAVGVATGVVINGTVRASRYHNSCSNLAYRCNRGEVWACVEHDQRCW